MALKLSEIKNHNKKREKFSSDRLFKQSQDDYFEPEERGVRPWESADDNRLIVRTIGAKEAVRKARSIVERNEMMSEFMNKNSGLSNLVDTSDIADKDVIPLQKFSNKVKDFMNFYFM